MIKVAVAIVFNAEGKILLTKRKDDVHLGGYWEFPGGKIELNETAQDAAVRECREECGILVKIVRLIERKDFVYPERKVHLHFFECEKVDQAEVKSLQSVGFVWVDPNHLNTYRLPPANDSVLEKIRVRKGV